MILQNHEEIRTTKGLALVFGGFPPQHPSHPQFSRAFIDTDSRDSSEKRVAVFQNVGKVNDLQFTL